MSDTSQLSLSAFFPLPYFMERGQENTLSVWVERDGSSPEIESATVTIYDAKGAVSETGAADVDGEPGSAKYTGVPPVTEPYGEGWRVRWVITLADGAGTHTFENSAMLVRERGVCPVTSRILWIEAPALNPDGTDPITRMSKQEQANAITLAWIRVQQRLLSYGKRPYLVVGSHTLAEVTTFTALSIIFGGLAHRENATYGAEAELYRTRAEEAWKRVQLTYDETQDGVPDPGSLAAKPATIWVGKGR